MNDGGCVAERVGFEPTVPLPGQLLSRQPDSAALAPLHAVTICRGRDSNPYRLSPTSTSSLRVYQFHHLGISIVWIDKRRFNWNFDSRYRPFSLSQSG
jgi:hypothetical protein